MPLTVTALYAGINTLIMVGLAVRIALRRRALGIGVGDGGDPILARAIRVHGNNIEYVPYGLILIAALESAGHGPLTLHALGASLTLARLAHAQGLAASPGVTPGRLAGIAGTWTILIVGAVLAIGSAL